MDPLPIITERFVPESINKRTSQVPCFQRFDNAAPYFHRLRYLDTVEVWRSSRHGPTTQNKELTTYRRSYSVLRLFCDKRLFAQNRPLGSRGKDADSDVTANRPTCSLASAASINTSTESLPPGPSPEFSTTFFQPDPIVNPQPAATAQKVADG